MINRIKLVILVLLGAIRLCAQPCDTAGYSKAYWFKGIQSSLVTKLLAGPNETLLMFGNMQVDYNLPSSHYACYITVLNGRGTPLKTNLVSFNNHVLLYDAAQSVDGNYFITGFTNNGAKGNDPWVAKVDADGNVLWSFGLGKPVGAFFKVAATADGGCVAGGRFAVQNEKDAHGNIIRAYNHGIVIRLDNTGKLVWGSEFNTDTEVEQVFEILQLHDGATVVSGVKNNSPNAGPGSDYFIMKLDGPSGHVLWQKESQFYFGKITELKNGTLLFRQSNFLYFADAVSGNVTAAKKFTLPAPYNNNYDLNYAGSFSDSEDLYYDFVDKRDILLFKLVNYDSVAWVSDLPAQSSFGNADNPFSALIQKSNNSRAIYLVGGLATKMLATTDSIFSEENSFLLKTSISGWSPCTITLNLHFSFTSLQPPTLNDFTWDALNSIDFKQPRTLATSQVFAQQAEKCYINGCCSDTTVYLYAHICKGGN
ncbi:MAG TPA: hypothetical protein VHB48_05690, partial [Chitinophagaceae bacterium]|nr:hypothetical protein [Chitinophagaceae bacterium]